MISAPLAPTECAHIVDEHAYGVRKRRREEPEEWTRQKIQELVRAAVDAVLEEKWCSGSTPGAGWPIDGLDQGREVEMDAHKIMVLDG